jgi:hypothetical protein
MLVQLTRNLQGRISFYDLTGERISLHLGLVNRVEPNAKLKRHAVIHFQHPISLDGVDRSYAVFKTSPEILHDMFKRIRSGMHVDISPYQRRRVAVNKVTRGRPLTATIAKRLTPGFEYRAPTTGEYLAAPHL